MKTTDARLPLFLFIAFVVLLIISTCKPAHAALSADERTLVTGLTKATADLRAKLAESQSTVAEQMGKLARTQDLANALAGANSKMAQDAIELKSSLDLANQAVQKVGAERDAAELRVAKEVKAHAATLAKYHKLKFYAAGLCGLLAGAIVGLLILRFGGLALNSIPGAAVAICAPGVVACTTFIFIQVFF